MSAINKKKGVAKIKEMKAVPWPGSRPLKPHRPTILEFIEKKEIFWSKNSSSYSGTTYNLIDALKSVPEGIALDQLSIFAKTSGRYSGGCNVSICKIDKILNPKFKEEWDKYNAQVADFPNKIKVYDEKIKEYNKYLKYKQTKESIKNKTGMDSLAAAKAKLQKELRVINKAIKLSEEDSE